MNNILVIYQWFHIILYILLLELLNLQKYRNTFEIDNKNGYKKCNKCQNTYSLNCFALDKRYNLYTTICKNCEKIKTQNYRKNNREKIRANERRYNKFIKHIPHFKERIKNEKRKYYLKNKLNCCISSVIRNSIKKNFRHWEILVDYTLDELKTHIESKFIENMNWDEFNKGNIQIDHILPRELFNFNTETDKQFKFCWSLNNLQPLWAKDNISKSDKLPDGKHARNLSLQEKKEYLISLGHKDLFDN